MEEVDDIELFPQFGRETDELGLDRAVSLEGETAVLLAGLGVGLGAGGAVGGMFAESLAKAKDEAKVEKKNKVENKKGE